MLLENPPALNTGGCLVFVYWKNTPNPKEIYISYTYIIYMIIFVYTHKIDTHAVYYIDFFLVVPFMFPIVSFLWYPNHNSIEYWKVLG